METRFKVFTEDQGLSSRNIRCLTQTKDGKIWLGTAVGDDGRKQTGNIYGYKWFTS